MNALNCGALAVLPMMLAYVGPGPGLSMMWALLGLLVTILAAFSAIAVWPVRLLMRRWRRRADSSESNRSAQG
jgi:hypothetical protein